MYLKADMFLKPSLIQTSIHVSFFPDIIKLPEAKWLIWEHIR